MKFFTRKKILMISLIFSIIAIYFGYTSSGGSCSLGYGYCESVSLSLLIFFPIFILDLVFWFTKDYQFEAWRKFIIWFTPISVLLVAISPRSPADLLPIYKKTIFLFSVFSLIVFSFVIMFYKLFKKSEKI